MRRTRLFKTLSSASLLMTLIAFSACNDMPVHNLKKNFSFTVSKDTEDAPPVKIDFLWVVDNSTSMCEEQVGLGNNFDAFIDTIKTSFDIDARLAVTTVDVHCDPGSQNINSARGTFNRKPVNPTSFRATCRFNRNHYCEENAHCDDLDCELFGNCDEPPTVNGNPAWLCTKPNAPVCYENPNGTVNTSCRRHCDTDQECRDLFQDDSYVCAKPDTSHEGSGCTPLPFLANPLECPDELPEFLDMSNIDLFPCLATVGVSTMSDCMKYEQPMRAADWALSPEGPNKEQAERFLRDDAYLVIIMISDEEDCSIPEDRDRPYRPDVSRIANATDYPKCGVLKTVDEGGPLAPVSHFVNKFKALKSDPSKVMVATIAGDSLATDPTERAQERTAYIESKSNPRSCYNETTICQGTTGMADYAPRLRELAESFGPNGSFSNICDASGMGVALNQIAETVVRVVNRVCLPQPIKGDLRVVRHRPGGEQTVLSLGNGEDTYRIIPTAEDCSEEGLLLPAIAFFDTPVAGEFVEITYEGDPGF